MGANIIGIRNKKERYTTHSSVPIYPIQVDDRKASDGSILDAERTGEKVARYTKIAPPKRTHMTDDHGRTRVAPYFSQTAE